MNSNTDQSPIIAGLDIGTTKVCVVIGRVAQNSTDTEIIGVAQARSVGLRKGVVINIDATVDAIWSRSRRCRTHGRCRYR